MMNNILKVVLIGGGAYLAYNYLKKRKETNLITAPSAAPNAGVDTPAVMDEAIMEEEGSNFSAAAGKDANGCTGTQRWCNVKSRCLPRSSWYGECVAGNASQGAMKPRVSRARVGASPRKSFARADGWDSDTISAGL